MTQGVEEKLAADRFRAPTDDPQLHEYHAYWHIITIDILNGQLFCVLMLRTW